MDRLIDTETWLYNQTKISINQQLTLIERHDKKKKIEGAREEKENKIDRKESSPRRAVSPGCLRRRRQADVSSAQTPQVRSVLA